VVIVGVVVVDLWSFLLIVQIQIASSSLVISGPKNTQHWLLKTSGTDSWNLIEIETISAIFNSNRYGNLLSCLQTTSDEPIKYMAVVGKVNNVPIFQPAAQHPEKLVIVFAKCQVFGKQKSISLALPNTSGPAGASTTLQIEHHLSEPYGGYSMVWRQLICFVLACVMGFGSDFPSI
jgi:hypothetical protein